MNENDLDSLDIQEEIDNFSNISFPTKKDNEQTIKLNGTLGNIRKSWTKTIKNHELSFDDLKTLSKNRLISDRQKLVEEMFSFQEKIEKCSRQSKQQKKYYHDSLDKKKYTSYNTISLQMEGLVAETEQTYNLMVNHNGFLAETLRSIDHLIYSIKNKLKFEDYI